MHHANVLHDWVHFFAGKAIWSRGYATRKVVPFLLNLISGESGRVANVVEILLGDKAIHVAVNLEPGNKEVQVFFGFILTRVGGAILSGGSERERVTL